MKKPIKRNPVAPALRSGLFRRKVVKNATKYQRKVKHKVKHYA